MIRQIRFLKGECGWVNFPDGAIKPGVVNGNEVIIIIIIIIIINIFIIIIIIIVCIIIITIIFIIIIIIITTTCRKPKGLYKKGNHWNFTLLYKKNGTSCYWRRCAYNHDNNYYKMISSAKSDECVVHMDTI